MIFIAKWCQNKWVVLSGTIECFSSVCECSIKTDGGVAAVCFVENRAPNGEMVMVMVGFGNKRPRRRPVEHRRAGASSLRFREAGVHLWNVVVVLSLVEVTSNWRSELVFFGEFSGTELSTVRVAGDDRRQREN